jgi:hypothetical protein
MLPRGLRNSPNQQLCVLLYAAFILACRKAPDAEPSELVTQVEALRSADDVAPTPAARTPPASAPMRSAEAASAGEPAFLGAPAPSSDPTWERPVEPGSERCPDVQRQARALGAALPRRLDPDTLATSVTARGCDLVFEYELTTLDAKDVAAGGMQAMSSRVSDQLCADRGALGVMQRGGRFTNVYYDRSRVPIGLFTVTAEDCGI